MECRLKKVRGRFGLTQEKLADVLGVSRQAIIALEAGRNLPSIPLALNIAKFFELPIEVIFYDESIVRKFDHKKGVNMDRELMPWSPWREMMDMRDTVDRMFDDSLISTSKAEINYPAINVRQTDKNVIVEADVPGMKQDEIEIEIAENTLSLKGERKHSEEIKKQDYYHREVSYGTFYRAIGLPVKVDPQKANAELEHGTLVVTLPKKEPQAAKTIKIKPKLK